MALTILKEADFRKALKSAPTGGYLFFGEEDYMKSAALRMARQSVTEADPAMAAFNDIRLDGMDFHPRRPAGRHDRPENDQCHHRHDAYARHQGNADGSECPAEQNRNLIRKGCRKMMRQP